MRQHRYEIFYPILRLSGAGTAERKSRPHKKYKRRQDDHGNQGQQEPNGGSS